MLSSFLRSLYELGINVKVACSPALKMGMFHLEPGAYQIEKTSSLAMAFQTVSKSFLINMDLLLVFNITTSDT